LWQYRYLWPKTHKRCLYSNLTHSPGESTSPHWARDYIHNVETFIGASEVEELTYLRDERRQLIKLIKELKTENRRLQKKLKPPR
jgi:hypothetical protein